MKCKRASFLTEGSSGIFTQNCNNIEEALMAINELWYEDYDFNVKKYGNLSFNSLNVKEDIMIYHRPCEFYNIGDDATCCECGEICMGKPRKTFVIYFDNLE